MNERNSHHLGDEGTDGYKNQDVAGAFVNKCQISDPKVLSVALPVKSRQWLPSPDFSHSLTVFPIFSLCVLFLLRLYEYFIAKVINIHSDSFA